MVAGRIPGFARDVEANDTIIRAAHTGQPDIPT
jgi:hypothetical protein